MKLLPSHVEKVKRVLLIIVILVCASEVTVLFCRIIPQILNSTKHDIVTAFWSAQPNIFPVFCFYSIIVIGYTLNDKQQQFAIWTAFSAWILFWAGLFVSAILMSTIGEFFSVPHFIVCAFGTALVGGFLLAGMLQKQKPEFGDDASGNEGRKENTIQYNPFHITEDDAKLIVADHHSSWRQDAPPYLPISSLPTDKYTLECALKIAYRSYYPMSDGNADAYEAAYCHLEFYVEDRLAMILSDECNTWPLNINDAWDRGEIIGWICARAHARANEWRAFAEQVARDKGVPGESEPEIRSAD